MTATATATAMATAVVVFSPPLTLPLPPPIVGEEYRLPEFMAIPSISISFMNETLNTSRNNNS